MEVQLKGPTRETKHKEHHTQMVAEGPLPHGGNKELAHIFTISAAKVTLPRPSAADLPAL